MNFARFLFYSFPVRLLVLHMRNHLMLISLWVFLVLLTSGKMGSFYGIHYLLLTPEYLGKVGFWSFVILGISAGWLFMTWHLTSYLLVSNRFPFLATLKAPFTKFCINNSVIPFIFFIAYLGLSVWFQWHFELARVMEIVRNIGGFIVGFSFLVFILSGYFFLTNKDLYNFLHIGKVVPSGTKLLVPGKKTPSIWEIQSGFTRYRVDYYLTEKVKWRPVRNVSHYNREILSKVFEQNHLNAVLVQVTSLLFLMALGLVMEQPWARIPAGATIFILAALFIAAFGALIFWFRHWGTLAFLFMAVALNYLTGLEIFNYRSRAIGLSYEQPIRSEYSYQAMQSLCTDSIVASDKAKTIAILNQWAARNSAPDGKKPKLVLLCFSGGGLRSSQWSLQALAQVNAATNGHLFEHTALITGASGGMYGASYYRQLMMQMEKSKVLSLSKDQEFLLGGSADLLNPITFAIISNDLFYPMTKIKVGEHYYRRDRGYMLEKALTENTDGALSGTISRYADAERQAQIPMMVLTPFVLNDGRKMLISAQPMSYLMLPPETATTSGHLEIDAVDFRSLFRDHQPDSLLLTTALRMNSTYPLILPNVWLPTKPAIEVMDAGLRDNYGVSTAVRFAHVFSDWVKENTSGVVMVQIRCWGKIDPIKKSDQKGMVEDFIGKATVAGLMTNIEDYRQDNDLALLSSILGPDQLNIVRFIYQPMHKESEASLSFHLSKRERLDILNAFYRPENLQEVERLKKLLD
jgi:hypothetical protein